MMQPLYAISYAQLVDIFAIFFAVQFCMAFVFWFFAILAMHLIERFFDGLCPSGGQGEPGDAPSFPR